MLWLNLGLILCIAALATAVLSVVRPRFWAVGRVLVTLGLQASGIFIVCWFLVERGQALAPSLPPPPDVLAGIWTQLVGPLLASIELIALAAVWGTGAGTATAAALTWWRTRRLEALVGVASVIWVIPTFLLAILAQDLQALIYGLSGINVSGGYGQATPGQIFWSAAVLAVRPAAYSFRQGQVLIRDQASSDSVRTAIAKGLSWRRVALRHIVRPAAAGLTQTSASSLRLMFGSLPLVEFFFAYPGLGNLLLTSLGVPQGTNSATPDPALAIAAAASLAMMLALFEAASRIGALRLDPRLADLAAT